MDLVQEIALPNGVRIGREKCNAGFTLVELIVAFGMLLILGTLGAFFYRGLLDDAREAVCVTNVKALTTAVELYVWENEALPAVLGDLKVEQVEKAYAQVMEEGGWYAKFSQFLLEMNLSDEAYAERLLKYDKLKKYGVAKNVFRCPNDDNGGVSYGINKRIANMKWHKIKDDALVIGDCDSPVFTSEDQLKRRHRKGTIAVASTKNKRIKKRRKRESGEVDAALDVDVDDAALILSP